MSNLLIFLEELGFSPRRVSVEGGGEYSSPCPSCGDGGKGRGSDRFHIWPDEPNKSGLCSGRFWCRQCKISGDTIEFLIKFHGMDFPAACAHLGIHTEGNNSPGYRQPKTPAPPKAVTFTPREYPLPSSTWTAKATAFLDDCHKRLLDRRDALAWLAARGIGINAVLEYRLGFNESSKSGDRYRPRSIWGLAEKQVDGKAKKLWLPRGWVIPAFTADGVLYQLRIRRMDEDIARFADDIKYLRVEGSSDATMVLHHTAKAFVVVECGFDAILCASLFDGKLGAVTTWNASARPDIHAHRILSGSSAILNALDCDEAGKKEQAWWRETYRQYRRWPVPQGKDPGDAYKDHGVDIRQWIIQGLPPTLVSMVFEDELRHQSQSMEIEQPEQNPIDAQQEPSPFASDIEELKSLLAEANGFFSVYGQGSGVGARINPEWSLENRAKRRRISELLNTSEEVGAMICRLGDGVYNHMTLPV